MDKSISVTTLFVDIGGVLLTDGWGHEFAQGPSKQAVYIENIPMFVQIAEGLGMRGICHTDYKSTCEKMALFELEIEI